MLVPLPIKTGPLENVEIPVAFIVPLIALTVIVELLEIPELVICVKRSRGILVWCYWPG